jgi:hypothetical protein
MAINFAVTLTVGRLTPPPPPEIAETAETLEEMRLPRVRERSSEG